MTPHNTECYFGTSCLSAPVVLVVVICRQTLTHPPFFSWFSPFTADPHPPHGLTNYRHSDVE